MKNKEIDRPIYQHWTPQAITCYKQTTCIDCLQEKLCESLPKKNPYHIKPMRYSMLMIYSRNGKPKNE